MTVLSRVDSSTILARQDARESAARTYARHFPIVPVRAEGMTIHGADGRTYLDCLSGAGTLALGHNHPVVVDAIRRTMDAERPLHTLDLATPEKDEFVDELFATLPTPFVDRAKVQFCGPAGTDAIEAAIKLTQTATGRGGVAAFTGAYHGMTLAALTASGGIAARTPLAGPSLDVTRLPYPYPYRCPLGLGGDLGANAAASYVERLLDDPSSGILPPAAMLLEPVQGEGGVIPAPDDWLRRMRAVTRRHGVPLVVDEVQTGVGRTGTMWAHEHAGVVPDVLVASKAIGGGLPLAVVLYRDDLDVWAPGAHAGTFRGTTLAMAAGAATLRYVRENDLPAHAEAVGARLLGGLRSLAAEHPAIGDVRGRGLMLGVELIDVDVDADHLGARPAASKLAGRVRAECLRRGLLVELGGRHDAVLRLLPPLIITPAQADAVLDRLADALRAAA
ncbi:diaminobutyrate--2-oxoglutarate transaminase family protein [Cryptosporangium minutisporangium]|uniref:Diaminobutyrate--2-oxoglutarate transaminase n=1 Tax=Cryptosporangium minutisporangium TaxID=113569 RepID=A0ABP6SWE2_9ACTN